MTMLLFVFALQLGPTSALSSRLEAWPTDPRPHAQA
jgi:hypothetical protein